MSFNNVNYGLLINNINYILATKANIINPIFISDVSINGNMFVNKSSILKSLTIGNINISGLETINNNLIIETRTNTIINDNFSSNEDNTKLDYINIGNGTFIVNNNNVIINSPIFTGTISGITKDMIGLKYVDNISDISKPISYLTLKELELKAPLFNPIFTGTISGITKDMVGLKYVDNISDISKPISYLTKKELDLKATIAGVNTSLALKANIASPIFTGSVGIGICNLTASTNTGLSIDVEVVAQNFHASIPSVSYANLLGLSTYTIGQVMQFGSNLVDPQNNYSITKYTFTAPYSCYVKVECCCTISSGSGSVQLELYKNGLDAGLPELIHISSGYGSQNGFGVAVIECVTGTKLDIRSAKTSIIGAGSVIYTIL